MDTLPPLSKITEIEIPLANLQLKDTHEGRTNLSEPPSTVDANNPLPWPIPTPKTELGDSSAEPVTRTDTEQTAPDSKQIDYGGWNITWNADGSLSVGGRYNVTEMNPFPSSFAPTVQNPAAVSEMSDTTMGSRRAKSLKKAREERRSRKEEYRKKKFRRQREPGSGSEMEE